MLDPVSNKVDFAAQEEDVLAFWKDQDVFRRSVEQRPEDQSFVFYDGPPFATGLPHYGHLLAGTIKDVIPRYQAMRGRRVERRFGWDCHGLPIENEIEKSLGISGKKQIEEYGIDRFNEACRGTVQRYAGEWERIVMRAGRWVDFRNDYKTMDLSFMESIWWVFKTCWDKGLIYEGKKSMPFCPRCSTPLSNFEVQLAYKEVKDPALTVGFRAIDDDRLVFLAWTTTPWTLPSNLALTVGSDIDYDFVELEGTTYVCASARRDALFGKEESARVMRQAKGHELVGRHYVPLFPWFSTLAAEGAFRIVGGDFVTTEDGTGIVHTAPGFGEDDFNIGQAEGIPLVCPMDMEGQFTDEIPEYEGRFVKDVDDLVIRRLKEEGKLFRKEAYVHNYPHCWRCDSPLFYRAITTWFLSVAPIKEAMQAANAETNWVPAHLRDGRFGNWLANARDWAISRNRYWGTPLPVWKCEDGHATCLGSVAELQEKSGATVVDLHKHIVDDLVITCPEAGCKKTAHRIEEVLDCWFESGSMPYAQVHYPFENKVWFESNFPADFIAEGLDQTRGWFYSLTVLGTALFGTSPFRNVIVNGLVLAEDGKKMSKRLKNYPEPLEVINACGADAMRLALMHSGAVRAEDLRFSKAAVELELRSILIPLWNAYAFFVSYARTDGFDPACDLDPAAPTNPLDRWILSRLQGLETTVTASMDAYDLKVSVDAFVAFVDELTNWYIRRSRRRFWKSEDDADKCQAHSTLYRVLLELSQVLAPYVPFVAEVIWRNLRTAEHADSVHLSDFPAPDASLRDPELDRHMDRAIRAASMGRALRVKHEIKVRQPLSAIILVTRDAAERQALETLSQLVREELNVKELRFTANEDDLVKVSAKGNFRALGQRLGKDTPKIAALVPGLDTKAIRALEAGETLVLEAGDIRCEITIDDLVLHREQREGLLVENDGTLTVGIETELTPELIAEGHARELVSRLQGLRKDMDLELTDRVTVHFATDDDELAAAIE
ncbi:MAG: isoleucine--tRNA ligase, partial [Planctomycetes bacterium]|nr:isoleucine--tRNA ligase [Planctomycetota bacterium]